MRMLHRFNTSGTNRGVGLLVASLSVNVLLLSLATVWVVKKGGLRYVGEQVGVIRTVHDWKPWQVDWRDRYEALPNTKREIVFLGDSITARMPWAEYYSPIRNRGIGGDTTDGVLQRLKEVTESNPRQVFINIGTNDLAKETPPQQVIENIIAIARRIKQSSSNTRVYVCSILPINLTISDDIRKSWKHKQIPVVNKALQVSQESEGYTFVDLTDTFSDDQGYLKKQWTTDGLHLNDRGMAAYCEQIAHLVSTDIASGVSR